MRYTKWCFSSWNPALPPFLAAQPASEWPTVIVDFGWSPFALYSWVVWWTTWLNPIENDYFLKVAFFQKIINKLIIRSSNFGTKIKLKTKGGLISESFSLWLKSPKKVPNHYFEHFLFRWIVLRVVVIWHYFLDVWTKLENLFLSHLFILFTVHQPEGGF